MAQEVSAALLGGTDSHRNAEVMASLKAKQVQHFDWTYSTAYCGSIDTAHATAVEVSGAANCA